MVREEGRDVPPLSLGCKASHVPPLRPSHRYTISARIFVDDQLRFINTTAYPVITGGNPSELEVVVEPVG